MWTIKDKADLQRFAQENEVAPNWHEPDQSGVGARIIGAHFDNAMGSTTRHEGEDFGEFNVVLTVEDEQARSVDVAVVNLATLFSIAAMPQQDIQQASDEDATVTQLAKTNELLEQQNSILEQMILPLRQTARNSL